MARNKSKAGSGRKARKQAAATPARTPRPVLRLSQLDAPEHPPVPRRAVDVPPAADVPPLEEPLPPEELPMAEPEVREDEFPPVEPTEETPYEEPMTEAEPLSEPEEAIENPPEPMAEEPMPPQIAEPAPEEVWEEPLPPEPMPAPEKPKRFRFRRRPEAELFEGDDVQVLDVDAMMQEPIPSEEEPASAAAEEEITGGETEPVEPADAPEPPVETADEPVAAEEPTDNGLTPEPDEAAADPEEPEQPQPAKKTSRGKRSKAKAAKVAAMVDEAIAEVAETEPIAAADPLPLEEDAAAEAELTTADQELTEEPAAEPALEQAISDEAVAAEALPEAAPAVSRRKRRAGIMIAGAAASLLAAAVLGWYFLRPVASPVPANIRHSVNFAVYYPQSSKLPPGYSLDPASFRLLQPGIVEYAVSNGSQQLVFTETKSPASDVINKFMSSFIPLHTDITTNLGKAEMGAAAQGSRLRTIVSLPVTGGPWLIITAPANFSQTDMRQILQSLTK